MATINGEEVRRSLEQALGNYYKSLPINQINSIIGEELKDFQEEIFDSEGALIGEVWQDLTLSTIESRERRKKWPGKIGQVTGILAGSFDYKLKGNGLEFGSNVEYAEHFSNNRPLMTDKLPDIWYQGIADKIAKLLSS